MRTDNNSNSDWWSGAAKTYEKLEMPFFQGALTTYIMVGVDQPGARILEVASGTGTHAEIVALSLLSREQKPVFVTCDFSEEMVKMLEERFKHSDYGLIQGNAVDIDSKTDYTGGD